MGMARGKRGEKVSGCSTVELDWGVKKDRPWIVMLCIAYLSVVAFIAYTLLKTK